MSSCECGCGSSVRPGRRFVQYHHLPQLHEAMSGDTSPLWKGGRISGDYVRVYAPDHPRAYQKYIHEHVFVAERALGKYLPEGAEVHHVNGDRSDNRSGNLVVCQDNAYHSLVHQRQRALDACGHAGWRKCYACGQYDEPENLTICNSSYAYHRDCHARHHYAYMERRRARTRENDNGER